MSKALEGVRILDMGHVQAAPTATQLLAWMGADVIKVEMPGRGDITRGQLRDVKGADSLYFTMLNSNKRSITINLKSPGGKKVLEELIRQLRRHRREFRPRRARPAGFHLGAHPARSTRASSMPRSRGSGPGRYADFKAYENVAQCMGGAASTTGWEDGPPTVTGAQIGDSGTGVHLVAGILGGAVPARAHRQGPARRGGDDRLGAESVPGQDARPAAPGAGAAAGISEQGIRRRRCRAPATPRAAASPARRCAARRAGRTTMSMSSSSRRPGSR